MNLAQMAKGKQMGTLLSLPTYMAANMLGRVSAGVMEGGQGSRLASSVSRGVGRASYGMARLARGIGNVPNWGYGAGAMAGGAAMGYGAYRFANRGNRRRRY